MANPKPLMANSSGTDQREAAVQSALRTLDAEASGIAAITAALQSDLGAPFTAAAELIRNAKGRVIVTGLANQAISAARSRRPSLPPARRRFSSMPRKRATAISA